MYTHVHYFITQQVICAYSVSITSFQTMLKLQPAEVPTPLVCPFSNQPHAGLTGHKTPVDHRDKCLAPCDPQQTRHTPVCPLR